MSSLTLIVATMLSTSMVLCIILLYLSTKNIGQTLKHLKHILLSLLLFMPFIIYSALGISLKFRTTNLSLGLIMIALLCLFLYVVYKKG